MNAPNLFEPPKHDQLVSLRSEERSEGENVDAWQIVEPLYRATAYLRVIGVLFLIFSMLGIIESIKNANVFALIVTVFPLWAGGALVLGCKQIQDAYRLGQRKKFKRAAEKVRISAIFSLWIMIVYTILILLLVYAFPTAF